MLKKMVIKQLLVWHLGLGAGLVDWNQPIKPGPNEVGFDYSLSWQQPKIGCLQYTLKMALCTI